MSYRERIQHFRELVNLRLFASKTFVLGLLTWITLVISLFSLLAIVYYYGFPQTPETLKTIHLIIRLSIWFYIIKYLIRIFYDFHPGMFIRENRMDSIVFVLLILEEVFYMMTGSDILNRLFGELINVPVGDLSILAVQLYFFVIVGLELGKAAIKISHLRIPPARLLALSFFILIGTGTVMLSLPEMTTDGISFIDALFTSTSAACVTGLTVVDTGMAFTHKGHWIILMLIQMGGINIVAFGAFFAVFYRDSSSIKYQSLVKDLFDSGEMSQSRSILRSIIYFSLVIETLGTLLVYLSWGRNLEFPPGDSKLFHSLFHSISAFNNAGFSLFSQSFATEGLRTSWGLHGVIALLVFTGGIGFPVLQDLARILKKPSNWPHFYRHLQTHSKIVLRTSLYLVLAGLIMFYILYPVHYKDVDIGGRIMESLFQSIISRTAGFNSIDISQLGNALIISFSVLMFIGASPVSTGGGIRTTTFAIILKSTISGLMGDRNVTMLKHTLKPSLIHRAYTLAILYFLFLIIATVSLSIAEPNQPVEKVVFEGISALSTVGLSMGITASLGIPAKIILVLCMFVGRIGSITIILALIRKVAPVNYTYSHANVLLG